MTPINETLQPARRPESRPPLGCPRAQAEQLLAAARRAGRSQDEAVALNDLGVILTNQRQPAEAVSTLEPALTLAEKLGNAPLAAEVRANLGMALLGIPESDRAFTLLEQALAEARTRVDVYAEKLVLDKLGTACGWLRKHQQALHWFEQALALAQTLGDDAHQADLLWQLAIQHAELGQQAQALARGQATVLLLRKRKHPHVAWFADNLRKYATGKSGNELPGPASRMPAEQSPTLAAEQASGPGLLRMTFEAAKSMAKFLMTGLQWVPVAIQQERLRTCTGCPHHTGLRCRICGCFTNIKTRLAHEDCPLGKWPK